VSSTSTAQYVQTELIEFVKRSLQKIAPEHDLLADLEEKSSLFDQAATKYSAKVAS
jgi:coatomer protein complex subunit epsilon